MGMWETIPVAAGGVNFLKANRTYPLALSSLSRTPTTSIHYLSKASNPLIMIFFIVILVAFNNAFELSELSGE